MTTPKKEKWLFLLVILFGLSACNRQFSNTPTASPNPVMLSSEAQEKIVGVRYTKGVYSDIEKDVVEFGKMIQNDWLTITYNPSHITIEVQENTSEDSRTYLLELTTGVESTYVPITQTGNTSK